MSNSLKKMTFLSYQPITVREGCDIKNPDDLNMGQLRTEAVLERDKYFVEKLGYNPYWALGGSTLKDLMLSSVFCSPNNPFVVHIFHTDDYIRINKIKHELKVYGYLEGEALDFIDDSCCDVASEFLVKSMDDKSSYFLYFLPNLLKYDSYDFHVADGFGCPCDYFSKWPHEFLSSWDYEVKSCNRFLHSNLHFDRVIFVDSGIEPECVDDYIELRYAKIVFEMMILPVILECLSLENMTEDGCMRLSGLWLYKTCWTLRSIMQLYSIYTSACNDGTLDTGLYDDLIRQGYDLIIDNQNLLSVLVDDVKIYPNDLCPCGSEKKFKKCHGRMHFEHNW